MKKFIITILLVFGFIFSYGQPSGEEINKMQYEEWFPKIGQTDSYYIYETNIVVKLKLDSIKYYTYIEGNSWYKIQTKPSNLNGFFSKAYFIVVEDCKKGFIKRKTIVEKNTTLILSGGDAGVIIHKTYLKNLGIESVKPFVNIESNTVAYKKG